MKALIFDLDGTLVDTVYAHVFAWQRALAEVGLPIDGWRIHRRIGMSGGLFTRAVAREAGRALTDAEAEAIQRRHAELFRELLPERRPLPGAASCSRSCGTRASRMGSPPPVGGPRSTHHSRLSACRPT
jgi:beta-phosphoglucomutase-like phosphatase (HAD superfamily)